MTKTFTAYCGKGHPRVEFTDPLEFEAHMRREHRATKPGRPRWCNPTPYKWQAPKAPADASGLARVAADWDGTYWRGEPVLTLGCPSCADPVANDGGVWFDLGTTHPHTCGLATERSAA